VVLLRSLNPLAVARGDDLDDAVTIGDTVLSRSAILGAATSVAERAAQADRVAVLATPTAKTILAVVGALIAGVTVVPVPPDSGKAEREHILRDSGAQAWLGETDDHCEGLPVVPVRLHARSWHSYPEPAPQSTAFVLYTSGTTGPPKGVLLSRSAIAAGLDALAEAWDWTWRDTLVWDQRSLIQKETHPRDPRGREAISEYRVVERYGDTSFIEVRLVTGKRNQIRIQARLRGHTLVGERRYIFGQADMRPIDFPRQALHAARLTVSHPVMGRALMFEAPLPQDLTELVATLRRSG